MKIRKLIILFSCLFVIANAQAQESDSLDLMIGQMIMIGINESQEDEFRSALELIKNGKLSGIILFEKDLRQENTKAELARLIAKLQKKAPVPLFMGIDEEGGRVNRLKPKYGFPETASAAYLGKADNADTTRYYAGQTARTLNEFGFNVNYAPTVDVNINPENPVIAKAERSYSPSYDRVIFHASHFIESHNEYNVATVLKHFPGHGSSTADTHLGIADVSDTWVMEELFPYSVLIDSGMVRAIMSAHIVNRTLDDRMLPGTLSDKILTGILRNMLGFEGVVFSDDMHMGAISKYYGFEEAVVMAVNAGIDVLMFSNNVFEDERTSGVELHELIKSKVLSGEIRKERVIESYNWVMELKRSLGLLESGYSKNLVKRLKKLY